MARKMSGRLVALSASTVATIYLLVGLLVGNVVLAARRCLSQRDAKIGLTGRRSALQWEAHQL